MSPNRNSLVVVVSFPGVIADKTARSEENRFTSTGWGYTNKCLLLILYDLIEGCPPILPALARSLRCWVRAPCSAAVRSRRLKFMFGVGVGFR